MRWILLAFCVTLPCSLDAFGDMAAVSSFYHSVSAESPPYHGSPDLRASGESSGVGPSLPFSDVLYVEDSGWYQSDPFEDPIPVHAFASSALDVEAGGIGMVLESTFFDAWSFASTFWTVDVAFTVDADSHYAFSAFTTDPFPWEVGYATVSLMNLTTGNAVDLYSPDHQSGTLQSEEEYSLRVMGLLQGSPGASVQLDMSVSVIPAPGAASLAAIGLGVIAWSRRRLA